MKLFLLFSVLFCTTFLLSCQEEPWFEELQVHFALDVKGLKDTLRANKDTLILSVEVTQPTVYRNMTRGFNGKNEKVQLPEDTRFGFVYFAVRVPDNNSNSSTVEEDIDSHFIRIPVFGRFQRGLSSTFDVTSDKSVFLAKVVPAKRGLYVLKVNNHQIISKDVSMATHPSFNLPLEKRNFHLLSEQMKKNVGITNDYGRRTSIAFYVK